MASPTVLRVGIIGAGEVTQVIHLPTLSLLTHLFTVTALCDVSPSSLTHVSSKFHIPFTTTSSSTLCSHPSVDVVLIANSDEYHASCAIEAANNGKHVFIEKPMALTLSDANVIKDAAQRNGVQIYVGYMRRYAEAFSVFQSMLAESGPIRHVVVKDIIGPNSFFVSQSNTYPIKFTNDIPASASTDRTSRAHKILNEAIGEQHANDKRLSDVYRLLGSLGSHDLSFMREALGGLPSHCTSAFASHDGLFINANFVYSNSLLGKGETDYSVVYTTGIHNVGVFESFLEVWTDDRVLRIDIDTPYIKGLPINVTVKENDNGRYTEKVIRTTYADAYTSEFLQLHKALTGGRPMKTTPQDAMQDLDIFDMIMSQLHPKH